MLAQNDWVGGQLVVDHDDVGPDRPNRCDDLGLPCPAADSAHRDDHRPVGMIIQHSDGIRAELGDGDHDGARQPVSEWCANPPGDVSSGKRRLVLQLKDQWRSGERHVPGCDNGSLRGPGAGRFHCID